LLLARKSGVNGWKGEISLRKLLGRGREEASQTGRHCSPAGLVFWNLNMKYLVAISSHSGPDCHVSNWPYSADRRDNTATRPVLLKRD
jgi:hypothetical protein